jgi:polysaccharide deacetylase family protein (PEP-CTERM system associated)
MSPVSEQVNALTVDVEDYFQVEAFSDVVRPDTWDAWPRRVATNTRVLLDLFARHGVRGTFFVLGWVADREPDLVREIALAGHEVACHGFAHRPIYRQSPGEFRDDIRRARRRLEDLIGGPVEGYRAPTYSITRVSLWAVDILIEEGFRYDSSIFPVYHDRYGIPKAERFPYALSTPAGTLVEFPPSTLTVPGLGLNLPVAGGGYFRLLPYVLFRYALRHLNGKELQPAMFLVHPWEIDPGQPRVPGHPLARRRHRLNLARTLPRLQRLLRDFRFAPVTEVLRATAVPA